MFFISTLRRKQYLYGCVLLLLMCTLTLCLMLNSGSTPTRLQLFIQRVQSDGVLDPSKEYLIISNLVKPQKSSGEESETDVTICTQTSTSNLHYIEQLSKIWQGPISVAVFSHGNYVRYALHYMLYLHVCIERVHNHVTFHLVVPVSHPALKIKTMLNMEFDCKMTDTFTIGEARENYQDLKIPYPVNILRNVAIVYSTTSYIFMIDVDLSPSKRMRERIQEFLVLLSSRGTFENDKTAYVIPCFESNKKSTELDTKDNLKKEIDAGNVQAFYLADCWQCQAPTNYSRWLSVPSSPRTEILYHVTPTRLWEPFYIAKKKLFPLYDGRFKQYGFNRISQVCEAHMSGFTFVVMNDVFLVHNGFKLSQRFHPTRKKELDANWELFKSMKTELNAKYPMTNRTC